MAVPLEPRIRLILSRNWKADELLVPKDQVRLETRGWKALNDADRPRQFSIRKNDRYRICFVWEDGDAYDVEITDYHRG